MAFVEELAAMFDIDDFAEMVTFAGGVTAAAIFDADYALASAGPLGMDSTSPALTLATDDVPANPQGQSVTARGATYTIAAHHPDGTGVSLLLLEKA